MTKAVALYSGGLDSTLAILVMMKQGIDVTAITFLTHFGCDITDRSSCSKNPFTASEKFGFQVKLAHLADKFLEIVKNPKFGHGKNMNPCIDCRILMLKEAKEFMKLLGADFIITGEVLGQRPMSQRRECFPLIDREAGLEGLVVRPLSGKLLPPTIPEKKGLIKRELMYDFRGRSRKPQMALAEEFGLTEYPSPAGGCLLTDPVYSWRLKDLLTHNPDPDITDINLLRVGRHFRYSESCKIIVGRNKQENETIRSLIKGDDYVIRVLGHPGPVTIVRGTIDNDTLRIAASICARYSDARRLDHVRVLIMKGDNHVSLTVSPARDEDIVEMRIEPQKQRSYSHSYPI